MKAYEEAVKEKYRFFSFGDAMFIKWNFLCGVLTPDEFSWTYTLKGHLVQERAAVNSTLKKGSITDASYRIK
jgi:hypothetical protein